jgi:hypothetical protein
MQKIWSVVDLLCRNPHWWTPIILSKYGLNLERRIEIIWLNFCMTLFHFIRACSTNGEKGFTQVLVESPERKRPVWRRRSRWEGNIKMYLREIGWGVTDWLHLTQWREQWRALVSTVMNPMFHNILGNSWDDNRLVHGVRKLIRRAACLSTLPALFYHPSNLLVTVVSSAFFHHPAFKYKYLYNKTDILSLPTKTYLKLNFVNNTGGFGNNGKSFNIL